MTLSLSIDKLQDLGESKSNVVIGKGERMGLHALECSLPVYRTAFG